MRSSFDTDVKFVVNPANGYKNLSQTIDSMSMSIRASRSRASTNRRKLFQSQRQDCPGDDVILEAAPGELQSEYDKLKQE